MAKFKVGDRVEFIQYNLAYKGKVVNIEDNNGLAFPYYVIACDDGNSVIMAEYCLNLTDVVRVARVRFPYGYNKSKLYDFKTDIDLSPGDTVVVDSNGQLTIAVVVEMSNDTSKATKWVVDYVDLSEHNERLNKNARLKEIKNKLNRRKQELGDMALYKLIANDDPETARLLNEYKTVEEGV